jgi:hypothetical protein
MLRLLESIPANAWKGDSDQPELVIFWRSRFLIKLKTLLEQIETIVKLVRSKESGDKIMDVPSVHIASG